LHTQLLSQRIRLLGFLPLAFFLAQAMHYWQIKQMGHLLWMCNIGNVLLAIGLFSAQPVLIRVAVIWSIPGLFIWLRYVFADWFHYATIDWGAVVSSTLAHIGGLTVGLVTMRGVRVDRSSWLYAFGWYLAVQLVSRFATRPELNVNVSHAVYPGWQDAFNSYLKFWVVMTAAVALCLWLITRFLNQLWPVLKASP
jgi:hypothetical protein